MTLALAAFLAGMIFALAVIAAWALAAANTVTDREARACPVCGGEPQDDAPMLEAMAHEARWAHFDPDEHRLLFDHCDGRVRRELSSWPWPR